MEAVQTTFRLSRHRVLAIAYASPSRSLLPKAAVTWSTYTGGSPGLSGPQLSRHQLLELVTQFMAPSVVLSYQHCRTTRFGVNRWCVVILGGFSCCSRYHDSCVFRGMSGGIVLHDWFGHYHGLLKRHVQSQRRRVGYKRMSAVPKWLVQSERRRISHQRVSTLPHRVILSNERDERTNSMPLFSLCDYGSYHCFILHGKYHRC